MRPLPLMVSLVALAAARGRVMEHSGVPGTGMVSLSVDETRAIRLADEQPAYVSASIGLAVFPHDAQLAEDLLRRSDAAMYAAKRQGRDRCKRAQARS